MEVVSMKNPNSNCLADMSCPDCGQHEMFKIVGTAVFEIADDGTGDYNDVEFYDSDYASCPKCNWSGLVFDLQEKNRRDEETIH